MTSLYIDPISCVTDDISNSSFEAYRKHIEGVATQLCYSDEIRRTISEATTVSQLDRIMRGARLNAGQSDKPIQIKAVSSGVKDRHPKSLGEQQILSLKLTEEAVLLKNQGLTYKQIAETLNRKYNLSMSRNLTIYYTKKGENHDKARKN
jgi:hypothetical protein